MQTEIETDERKNLGADRVEFTEEIFDQICERMAQGKGLREICSDPEMPDRSTVMRWIKTDTGRQARYQEAREALMDWYAEEIISIAWDDSKDTIKRDGKPDLCNHEWIGRSRLKVDSLKFLMAKLHPRRYGDKIDPANDDPLKIGLKRFSVHWQYPDGSTRPLESETGGATVDDLMRTIDGRTRTLEREIIEPIHDDAGNIINASDPRALRKRIIELEQRLGLREGEQQPPKLLTYDPGPLPSRMDGEIVLKLVNVIKANVPNADQRDPETVLDEVLSECAKALQAKYGASEAA